MSLRGLEVALWENGGEKAEEMNNEYPLVPDLSADYPPGTGYRLLSGTHAHLGTSGMACRKNRMPGTSNMQVWGQAAWAGDSRVTAVEIFGRVPGDSNGDGDNTDLGEPCFPHDSRDLFIAEDTTYNFSLSSAWPTRDGQMPGPGSLSWTRKGSIWKFTGKCRDSHG